MSIEQIYDLIDRREFEKVEESIKPLLGILGPLEVEFIRFLTNIESGRFDTLASDLVSIQERYASTISEFDKFRIFLLNADLSFKQYDWENWKRFLTQAENLAKNITEENFLTHRWLGQFYLRKARANNIIGRYTEALESLNQGLVHIKSTNNPIFQAKALWLTGSTYPQLGRFEEGIDALKFGISLLPDGVNFRDKAYALINLGMIRQTMGEYTKAIDNLDEAKTLATDLKDYEALVAVLFNLSHIYMLRHEFSFAKTLIKKGLHIAKNHNLEEDEVRLLVKQAELMGKTNLIEKGIDTINIALELIRTKNMSLENPGELLLVLGGLYYSNGDFEVAIDKFSKAYNGYTEKNSKLEAARVLNHIGKCYEAMGQFDEAEKYYLQKLTEERSLQQPVGILLAKINIARLDYKRGDLDNAKIILSDLLIEAKSLNSTKFKAIILHDLSEIARLEGNIDVALKLNMDSQDLFHKIGNKHQQQKLYYLSAKILGDFGRYKEMFEEFKKSEVLAYETEDHVHLGRLWFEEVVWFVQQGRLDEGIDKMKQLRGLSNEVKNSKLIVLSNIATAFLAKQSKEGYEFFQAKHQFIEVLKQQTLDFDLRVFVLINLAQILLNEWKLFKNETTLEEINSIINDLQNLSTRYHNPTLKINLFILSLHLYLLHNDFQSAHEILVKASNIARSFNNPALVDLVDEEEKEFTEYVLMIKRLGDDVAPIEEAHQMKRIFAYIEKALESQNTFTRDLNIVQDETDRLEKTS